MKVEGYCPRDEEQPDRIVLDDIQGKVKRSECPENGNVDSIFLHGVISYL